MCGLYLNSAQGTWLLKTKKHGNICVVSPYCDGEKQQISDVLKTLHGKARKDGMQLLILGATLQSMMNAKLSEQRFWHCHENGLIKTIQMIPHNL